MYLCFAMVLREHLSSTLFDWVCMSKLDLPCDLLLTQKGLSLVCLIPETVSESLNRSIPFSIKYLYPALLLVAKYSMLTAIAVEILFLLANSGIGPL